MFFFKLRDDALRMEDNYVIEYIVTITTPLTFISFIDPKLRLKHQF